MTVIRNATFPTPAGSPQVVPDPTTTAVLIQNAALNQRPCVFHPNVTADSKENPGISHVGVEYAPPPFQARELKSAKNEIVGINKASIPLPAFSGEGTQKREK
ncbi:hypothetical protein [Thiolapillus sp.]|uniref:hypothetical protein n=2 Tax=Thiolapillus sp. TaxID=2017437 RepID=UPI003AF9DFD9